MDISDYIRFKLFYERESKSIMDQHQTLLMRLTIDSYLKIDAIANKNLTKVVLKDIKQQAITEFKKLGIEKT